MSIYTDPPEWEEHGRKPPSSKRREGWKPGDRVPASWLNWFWFSTVNSLREIAQAFVNHRDASAPHDGHETKEGATAKVEAHSQKTTDVHGVEAGFFVAKTSRTDQRVGWQDIVDKPSEYPPVVHDHDDRYYTKAQSDGRYAPKQHSHGASDLPIASTAQRGIVQLTNDRTSRSEELALTARAMDDHRTSGDHDSRYYRKEEVNQLLETIDTAQQLWAAPSSNWRATWTGNTWARDLRFFAPVPGRYRVQLVARADEVWSDNITDGGGYVTLGGRVYVAAAGVALSDGVWITSPTPTVVVLDMTLPGAGWLEIGLIPERETIPHWEDPSEYPDEHLVGDVLVTELRVGCDIISHRISDVIGEVRAVDV